MWEGPESEGSGSGSDAETLVVAEDPMDMVRLALAERPSSGDSLKRSSGSVPGGHSDEPLAKRTCGGDPEPAAIEQSGGASEPAAIEQSGGDDEIKASGPDEEVAEGGVTGEGGVTEGESQQGESQKGELNVLRVEPQKRESPVASVNSGDAPELAVGPTGIEDLAFRSRLETARPRRRWKDRIAISRSGAPEPAAPCLCSASL